MTREHVGDRGAALILALLATALLAALGGGLLLSTDTEAVLAHHHRAAGETLYGADAALERAVTELRAASWTGVLSGATHSPVMPPTTVPTTPWGAALDLVAVTARLQADSSVVYGTGLNAPAWRVYAAGSLDAMAAGPLPGSSAYLVVWVADDISETDNDPRTDTNEVIWLRALSANAAGMRVMVQAALQRVGGSVRVLAWRPVD
jgi:hypothetical protein